MEFLHKGSNILFGNMIREVNGTPLPKEDCQYRVPINHTAMCETIENITARRNLGLCYFPEQQACMDILLYEISQTDAEKVNTYHWKAAQV